MSSASSSKPLPSAREAGLTSIADALAAATKTPVAETKPALAPEPPVTQEKPVQAKPALLDSLPVEDKQAVELKQPKEDQVKRAAEWKRITDENKAFEAETATLRKQVEEAQGWKKELETIKPKAEKADEYAKRLYETAFEKSDDFQRIVSSQQDIITSAKALAKEFDVPEDVIDRAKLMKGRGRLEFLEETFPNATAAGEFVRMLSDYDAKESFKASEIKRSRETSDKIDASQRELAINEQARQKQEILQAYDATIPKFAEKLPGYFQKKDGDDAHNAMVDEIISTGRNIAEGGDAQVQAEALGLAAVARALIRRMPELQKENAMLRERLKAYSANEPRVPSGGDGSEINGTGERVGMMDRLKQGALR